MLDMLTLDMLTREHGLPPTLETSLWSQCVK